MAGRARGVTIPGCTALITGASSGIGAATTELLAARGAYPLLTGRDPAALRRMADRTGGEAWPADLATADGPADLVRRVAALSRGVDVLVCAAGIGAAGELAEMRGDLIDEVVAVNLVGHLHLVRGVLPGMLRRGRGQVVLVSSIAGCLGVAGEAVYAASKAALRAFADSLRLEAAGRGVGVTVVVPGVVDTPFFARRGAEYDRRWPRPIPADAVARALVAAIERGRSEVFTPGWLRLPARLHGLAPALVGAAQRRVAPATRRPDRDRESAALRRARAASSAGDRPAPGDHDLS